MAAKGHDDPSLLRFLLVRLDEEEHIISMNTPLESQASLDEDFVDRYVGRRALVQRTQAERDLVNVTVEVMRRVQGPPPVPLPTGPPDEATILGSEVLKLLASRFEWHPDYLKKWRPGT